MEVETENQTLEEQNPKSPSASCSDSPHHAESDSDSEDESHQNEELQTLETELSNNPSNYDAHVQYIKLLRKLGEIGKLRQAREAMSALFPLSPEMWQDWAKDETSLSTGPEGVAVVEKIYEQGVFDYLSVPLWCDYLNYIQEHDVSVSACLPNGISKARNLFERALTAASLHVTEGSQIWEEYREFEQAILHTIDENDIKAKESQVQRIRNLFHRQLSVPLVDLRSTLLAYKAWEVEQGTVLDVESSDLYGISAHLASAYQKAMEVYNARAQHEEQISMQDISDTEKFQNYMSYLKFEKSVGDPARVQVLYERAIAQFPVSSDLWLDYTRYLDTTLKVGNVLKDVYSRATKNCPWIGELWVKYLLCLERGRAHEKEIAAVYEKSLQCTFSTIEEYQDLFLTRVDGLRRKIESGVEANDVVDYSLIRQTFQYASDYLSPHLKNTDGLLHLHAYWARLEMSLGKDLVAARGVWESLLKISASMLEAWQGYIEMEIGWGQVNAARSIYKRCYSKRFTATGSEDICHSWLRFERQFGTLEDLFHAMHKVTPRLEELQLFRVQQESKPPTGSMDQREIPARKGAHEKRKGSSDNANERLPVKRQKLTAQTQTKGYEKDKDHSLKHDEVNKAEEDKTNAEMVDSKIQMKAASTARAKGYKDQCTVFISNLHFKANSEDLREFFSDVGGVVSIRILHDRNTGKSRGLAYVDFLDDQHLASAIAKNKQMLLGKRLSIARSDPKQSRRDGRKVPWEQGAAPASDRSGVNGNASKESAEIKKSDDNIQLKGKSTFAVPRNVLRTTVSAASKSKTVEEGDEKPKSNDEFRKMFIKD